MKVLAGITLLLMFNLSLSAQELKKVNYANETIDSKSNAQVPAEPQLTPEQSQKLMKDLENIKAKQIESQKYLEELDKDE